MSDKSIKGEVINGKQSEIIKSFLLGVLVGALIMSNIWMWLA